MAWDGNSQLLYLATADYDGAYPNSIVAINAGSGAVAQSQNVGSDPAFLSVSANGQYLYAAFATATEMTQLQLPGLNSPLTWALNNPLSSAVYWPGDMKAAPVSPHTTAVTLLDPGWQPAELGGVAIFDDSVLRPNLHYSVKVITKLGKWRKAGYESGSEGRSSERIKESQSSKIRTVQFAK